MTNKEKLEQDKKIKREESFTKAQILSSKRYADKKDLIGILLKEEQQYSFLEVDQLIKNFMEGKVE